MNRKIVIKRNGQTLEVILLRVGGKNVRVLNGTETFLVSRNDILEGLEPAPTPEEEALVQALENIPFKPSRIRDTFYTETSHSDVKGKKISLGDWVKINREAEEFPWTGRVGRVLEDHNGSISVRIPPTTAKEVPLLRNPVILRGEWVEVVANPLGI